MKILIFSTAYLPLVGGAELAIREITDRLPEHSFVLITARLRRTFLPRERIGNVEIHRVGWGISFDKWLLPFWGLRLAISLHKEEPFGAVWGIMASYGGLAASWFKRLFREVPFILTLQEGDSLSHIYKRARFFMPIFRRIFTRADRVTAISRFLAEWAQNMNVRAPIYVIPNGVDLDRFRIPEPNIKKEGLRERLGIKAGEKVIITTSRLVEKNGVGDLIAAMQYLPREVHLLILGTGHLEAPLKAQAKRLGLGVRAQFQGAVSPDEIQSYLHASDIFCRPSLSEGLGNSFLEAMAAGVPVVATPVGGIPDFLINGENGLFCEVSNPKSIAEQVRLLLGNDEFRKILVGNALRVVRERYNWDGIAQNMGKVFSGRLI